jgi:antitoxin (DNA-binding transcriptional repressor) of toxin-antitoxin stability system
VITQRELCDDNTKVIEAVAAGKSFAVTRHGVPVAELRPIRPTRRIFVPSAELMALAAAGLQIDSERFRADLDRVVDHGL